MIKQEFNDEGSIESNILTLNMRFNNDAIPLGSKNACSS